MLGGICVRILRVTIIREITVAGNQAISDIQTMTLVQQVLRKAGVYTTALSPAGTIDRLLTKTGWSLPTYCKSDVHRR
jgi:hypothetical protein